MNTADIIKKDLRDVKEAISDLADDGRFDRLLDLQYLAVTVMTRSVGSP